jgi:Ca-activated chloride channel family protein
MRQLRSVWGSIIFATFTCAVLASIPNSTVAATQITPNRGGPYGRGPVDPPPLETDLTLLTVTVADKSGAVSGLGRDRFQVLEDGVAQKISYFWMDNRPISVGFVMDGSNKMDDGMNESIRGAGPAFLKSKRADDEYFVIVSSDNPTMTISYTTDSKRMPSVFPQTGESPLYDAIYTGIDAMKEAANPRKLLVVIAAGFDNGKE